MRSTYLLASIAIAGIAVMFALPAPGERVRHTRVDDRLRAPPIRTAFLANGDDLDVVHEIHAGDAASHRLPDFSLVLDRTGSMSGAPVKKAKAAATEFVSRHEETDRPAFISFDDDAVRIDYLQ